MVETPGELVAIEVKSGTSLRPKDRRGLLAFHDEFPEARLVALTDAPLRVSDTPSDAQTRDGPGRWGAPRRRLV